MPVAETLNTNWGSLSVDFFLVDADNNCYRLRPPYTYNFGRDDLVNFQISDMLTSRRHCELRWDRERGWVLVDLSSKNGTYLNGSRLTEAQAIKDRDQLRVGGQQLTFLVLPHGTDAREYVQTRLDANVTSELAPDATPQPEGQFCGTLAETGLAPLLEFFLMTGKTGRLDVESEPAPGCIWFVAGVSRDASCGDLTGEQALRELAACDGGAFAFHEGIPLPGPVAITADPQLLLGELARMHNSLDEEDLDKAQNLQTHLLHRLPAIPGYDVAARYAAVSGLSGDFYDIGPMADGNVLITLGDVSGHGVQGALVVAMALKTLRMLRGTFTDPVELLKRLNDEVRTDLLPGQFITLFTAILTPASGRLQVVLAGHHQAQLLRRDGRVEMLGASGPAIGLMAGARFAAALKPRETTLSPGGLIFQCTDGLLEATGANDEEFGDKHLATALSHISAGMNAEAALDAIRQELDLFTGGKLADDLTLLALRRQPA
jgi:serine phosphatase RsbU (regulator of sigma subunit)